MQVTYFPIWCCIATRKVSVKRLQQNKNRIEIGLEFVVSLSICCVLLIADLTNQLTDSSYLIKILINDPVNISVHHIK